MPADRLSQIQLAQGGHRADRSLRWYGPQTRREFFALLVTRLRDRRGPVPAQEQVPDAHVPTQQSESNAQDPPGGRQQKLYG